MKGMAMDMLQAMEETVARVAATVGPAVVGIGGRRGAGSGVVVGPDRLLTNAHNARTEEVAVHLPDGRAAVGRVVGADVDGDLAVVAVETGTAPPVTWSEQAEEIPTGRIVLGLANPGGRGLRVSLGTVSGVGRRFRGPRGRVVTGGFEHTAPLPRGSSGGPVVDREGRLVGINTNRVGDSLYVARPATASLRERVEALGRGESREPLRLGLALAPAEAARRLRAAVGLPERDGLLVRAVEDGSPADRAGVLTGDLLVRAGDAELAAPDDLFAVLDAHDRNAPLALALVRGVEELTLEVGFAQP
jgi:serine protease Do